MDDVQRYIQLHCNGVEIIDSYVKLHKTGDVYRARCPFHSERTPSFTVYPTGHKTKTGKQDHDTWYCFGCHTSGDIFYFIKRIEHHKSNDETIQFFQDKYNIKYVPPSWEQSILEKLNTKKEVPIMSLDEINIKTSSACRKYLIYVRDNYPNLFDKEFQYIQSVYETLDNLFYSTPVVDLQNVVCDIEKMLINRKKSFIKE